MLRKCFKTPGVILTCLQNRMHGSRFACISKEPVTGIQVLAIYMEYLIVMRNELAEVYNIQGNMNCTRLDSQLV